MGISMGLCQMITKKSGRKTVLLVLFAFLTASVFAQEKMVVSGKVTNGRTALPDVSVKVSGAKTGTTTDDQGSFTISVALG